MTATSATSANFDFGRVVSNTFNVIGSNFRELAILSVLLIGLPSGVLGWAQVVLTNGGDAANLTGVAAVLLGLGGYLATVVGSTLLQAATVRVTVATLNGDATSPIRELQKSVAVILPVFMLGLLMGVGIVLGAIFFVVPGIILAVLWMVAMPVYVVERPGVFASLGRSRNLTRGHRWPIFGLLVVYLVAYFVVSMVLGGVIGAASAVGGGLTAITISSVVSAAISGAVAGVVAPAGIAAIYYELRVIKEGVGAAQLAAVFD
jgi:hypothetical protein